MYRRHSISIQAVQFASRRGSATTVADHPGSAMRMIAEEQVTDGDQSVSPQWTLNVPLYILPPLYRSEIAIDSNLQPLTFALSDGP